jgi:hypothetical protein
VNGVASALRHILLSHQGLFFLGGGTKAAIILVFDVPAYTLRGPGGGGSTVTVIAGTMVLMLVFDLLHLGDLVQLFQV